MIPDEALERIAKEHLELADVSFQTSVIPVSDEHAVREGAVSWAVTVEMNVLGKRISTTGLSEEIPMSFPKPLLEAISGHVWQIMAQLNAAMMSEQIRSIGEGDDDGR